MIIAFRKRAPGLFSWAIRLWTRSEFSHTEALFGTTMISAVEGMGVRACVVGTLLPAQWELVQVDCSPEQERKAYEWAVDELGCKYDWMGIFFCQVFKFGRQHKAKWFCSEFCTAVMQQTGQLLNARPHRQCPGRLYYLLTGARK